MYMEQQLEALRRIRDHLDERYQITQDEILGMAESKLGAAEVKLKALATIGSTDPCSSISPKRALSNRGKTRYVMLRDSVDKAIDDIESWLHFSFNPLWFVVLKAQAPQFDMELDHAKEKNCRHENKRITEVIAVRHPLGQASSTHIFLPAGKVVSARTAEIAFSSAKSVQIDNKWRLLDSVSQLSKEAVRDLAVKLRRTNPSTFGLLTCLGAVHNEIDDTFHLVFRMPDNMSDPETLRSRIIARNSNHSLSNRFRLARQLAQSVCSLHAFDLVHKSIRPENVVLFRDQESTLGSAFLLGFERVRAEVEKTRLTEDDDWEKNLYRHPQRQGSKIRERYIMQHDVYSLGVCMLEIGLWTTFVEYDNSSSEPKRSQKYDLGAECPKDVNHSEVVKTQLISLATGKLSEKMGTKYARIVESCLTCLDVGNEDFGDESEVQGDSTLIAVRYIEKVSYLHVVILDDFNSLTCQGPYAVE
jgi:hypothetical protein